MAEKNGGSFFPGLVAGGLAGAAAVFLFGTKKGRRIREDFEKRWPAIKKELVEILEEFGDSIEGGVVEVKEKIEEAAPPTSRFFHKNGEKLKARN